MARGRIALLLLVAGLLAGCGALSVPGQGTARTPRIGYLAPRISEDFLSGREIFNVNLRP